MDDQFNQVWKGAKSMEKIQFVATLFSTKKDRDGEVKVTFVVPKMHQLLALNLPEETNMLITVENELAQDAQS